MQSRIADMALAPSGTKDPVGMELHTRSAASREKYASDAPLPGCAFPRACTSKAKTACLLLLMKELGAGWRRREATPSPRRTTYALRS